MYHPLEMEIEMIGSSYRKNIKYKDRLIEPILSVNSTGHRFITDEYGNVYLCDISLSHLRDSWHEDVFLIFEAEKNNDYIIKISPAGDFVFLLGDTGKLYLYMMEEYDYHYSCHKNMYQHSEDIKILHNDIKNIYSSNGRNYATIGIDDEIYFYGNLDQNILTMTKKLIDDLTTKKISDIFFSNLDIYIMDTNGSIYLNGGYDPILINIDMVMFNYINDGSQNSDGRCFFVDKNNNIHIRSNNNYMNIHSKEKVLAISDYINSFFYITEIGIHNVKDDQYHKVPEVHNLINNISEYKFDCADIRLLKIINLKSAQAVL